MISEYVFLILLGVAGWTILCRLLYGWLKSVRSRSLRGLLAALLSLLLLGVGWWLLFSGNVRLESDWALQSNALLKNSGELIFLVVWLCLGFLLAKALNPKMPLPLRLLFALVCAFVIVHYAGDLVRLTYF